MTAPALANDVVPMAATPRVIRINNTRIDKYNAAGILLDGATGDTLPLTASGVTSQGILGGNQIVGRTVCVNFEVNGNCANPQIATNGPMYGQDGVRVTAGSSVNIADTLLTQNLVQGTGAPTRGAAAGNEFLNQASGLRLIGAGASQIQRSNIVDNSYGVFNAQLDGAAANNAVPIRASNNWWGLRANATTNPGPAIAPTTNPPVPENPVNSQAAVDFLPFRAGPQSDPNSGEFPVFSVPGPVNDSAPTVGVSTDKATYHLGENVVLSAAVGDDFGVKNVVFYDGPWAVGSADRKPYSVTYKLPTDIACAQRTLTAVAEDSAGQTASSSVQIGIAAGDCATPTPTATPTATATVTPQPTVQPPGGPSVEFVDPPLRLPTSGADFEVDPNAPAGLKQVDVFLGTTRICTLTTTPYVCRIRPTGGDVGIQEVRAVISDLAGSTAGGHGPRRGAALRAAGPGRQDQERRSQAHDHRRAQAAQPGLRERGLQQRHDHAHHQAQRQALRQLRAAAQGLLHRQEEAHDAGHAQRRRALQRQSRPRTGQRQDAEGQEMNSRLIGALALAAAFFVAAPAAHAQVDPAGCTDDLQYDPSIPTYNSVLGTALGSGTTGSSARRLTLELQTYQRAVVNATQNNPRVRVIEKKMSDTALGQ